MTAPQGSERPEDTIAEPAREHPEGTPDARLKADIEKTRTEMSATMTALEARLSPKEIREKVGDELHHVETKIREIVHEQLVEAKALVREELVEAKKLIGEQMSGAEDKVRKGLVEARQALKNDLEGAITGAKRSIRAATLGKVEDLATNVGDTMNDTRDTLIDTIWNNPIPATLAGIGLAWLLMNRSSSARRGGDSRGNSPYSGGNGGRSVMGDAQRAAGHVARNVGSTVGAAAHHASDAASSAIGHASDAASQVAHRASDMASGALHEVSETASSAMHEASALAVRAGETATHLAQGAGRQAMRVEQRFEAVLHESPLAVGAAALVAGAAVGFALPRTHGEDALMGETRDRFVARAEGAAHDAASAVGRVTEKSADEAKRLLGEGSSPAQR